MPRETKKVENYREASNESFASVFRSFSEINRSVIEFSKSSFNRAIEMQAQLAKKAYDSYISEASKLGQMFLSSYGRFVFRTGERPDLSVTNDRSGTNRAGTQRTAAHRVATERKTGAAKRHSRAKQSAKPKR